MKKEEESSNEGPGAPRQIQRSRSRDTNESRPRVGRIEGHINNIARDQNNALESNQRLWKSRQELKDQITKMDSGMQDKGTGIPYQELRGQQRAESDFKEETFRAFTQIRNEPTRREGVLIS